MRLAVVIAHPIQYYAPIFRELAARCDLHVFYGQPITRDHHETSGFGVGFDWDVDLLDGYNWSFLENVARRPDPNTFFGCDTPSVGAELANGMFDAVLIVGWYQKALLQALRAARLLRIPTLVRGDSRLSAQHNIMKRLVRRALYPTFLRCFDAALYVGASSKEYLDYYKYPSGRQFFSPHCVDNAFFAERGTVQAGQALRAKHGIAPRVPLILFAGKLVPFKRPLDVIEAARMVSIRGVPAQVLVAGSGELESAVVAGAAKLGVQVHALGFQNQTQLPAAYAAADVLALPSTGRETWGLVCNEALACGTPIVVSDAIGSAPDLAADGCVGRQYLLGDVCGLAAALRDVLESPPPLSKIRALSERYGLEPAVDGIVAAALSVQQSQSQLRRSK